jgi:hypothetical protein
MLHHFHFRIVSAKAGSQRHVDAVLRGRWNRRTPRQVDTPKDNAGVLRGGLESQADRSSRPVAAAMDATDMSQRSLKTTWPHGILAWLGTILGKTAAVAAALILSSGHHGG